MSAPSPTFVSDQLRLIPEADAVKAKAQAVLSDQIYWFGIRHHSPASARFVREAILARKPKVIFLEAPSDAQTMLQHIIDTQTKPPIAIYTSFRDDNYLLRSASNDEPPEKFDAWYPLLSYSPEYVTMVTAGQLGIPVIFIDLPFSARIKPNLTPVVDEGDPNASSDDSDQPTIAPGMSRWDDAAVTSRFYQVLAETGGYRNWDECWDSLFEVGLRHHDADGFRRDMTYFCAALRATTAPQRLESDDTLTREAHMWNSINSYMHSEHLKSSDAMVVCGGFHVFLERNSATEIPPVPPGTHFVTIAPFSYLRTSDHSGYSAGNRAPRYYERLYLPQETPASAAVTAMVDHVVAVLHKGRKAGEALSAADAISIAQHARMLASLRGRALPVLDDIRDAVMTCCCKGNPNEIGRILQTTMSEVETGTAVGRVTSALGKLPLVYDFYRLVEELDLGEVMAKDKRKKFTFDLRVPVDDRRSIFFHRLVQLGIPMARRIDESTSQLMFRETWTVEWSPKTDVSLIEKNLHGDTVEAAAAAVLADEVANTSGLTAATVTGFLLRAAALDLPSQFAALELVTGQVIDDDSNAASLGQALTQLVILRRQAHRTHIRTHSIDSLIERAYARGCFALPYVANAPAQEHAEIIAGIKAIAEVVLTQSIGTQSAATFDHELFIANAKTAYHDSQHPYLRGALAGVLTELRAHTTDQLAKEVAAFAGARGEVLAGCGEFLSGLVATSKTAMLLGAEPLVHAIDQLLRAASWDDFMILLPRARGAFEGMHERAKVSLADRVAVIYGLSAEDAASITTLSTSHSAATVLTRLDAEAEAIMQQWDFT
jgi:hypothetical protein